MKKGFILRISFLQLILLLGVIFLPLSTVAQSSSEENRIEHFAQTGISFSYSPHSFKAWGSIKNAKMALLKGQIWHTKMNLGDIETRWGSELIMANWINYPLDGIGGPSDNRWGFGLIPFHVLIPLADDEIEPFAAFSVGALYLNDRLPAYDGASINYLLDGGLGLNIPLSSNRSLQFGYKYQHLSNGNSRSENPGIDSHVFFLNLLFSP